MKVPILKSATHREVAPSEFSHRNGCFHTWNVPPSGFGKVRYIPGYWEWVEDVLPHHKIFLEDLKVYDAIYASLFTYDYNDNVLQAFCELWRPSTNTLSTFIGELSIFLWDLRTIGGLPMHGSFYDEVVPSAKELIEMDHQVKPFLSESCLYLFSAFHRLAKGEFHEFSVHDWVGFWFRGPSRYAEPLQKTSKVDHVRASVFKVASLMARGVKFSLAVLLLASIYHGLREISTSNDLIASDVIFPIHYVCGWMGEYFETHHRVNHMNRSLPLCKILGEKVDKYFNLSDARRLFQRDDARQLYHLALLRGKELHFTENGKLSDSFSEFFISLRSSYLTLRHDATFIVESYNPHRFSRQFGFCQDIPGDLMEQPYDGTLQALVQLWDSSTRLGTSLKFIVPLRPLNDVTLMTREYIDWWPIHRLDPSKKNPHIVSTSPRQDQVHVRSKGVPSRLKVKLPSPSSKPKTKSNDLLQAAQTLSKSKVMKDGNAPTKKKVRRRSLALKTTTTAPRYPTTLAKGRSA
ncbi:uncharacterized protein [Nicotiana sylvestris]|uniref:uncharacterized protein n=1 Tax=Nicotiana sylvestris TaxID=4096 RepID=UPI00388C3EFF